MFKRAVCKSVLLGCFSGSVLLSTCYKFHEHVVEAKIRQPIDIEFQEKPLVAVKKEENKIDDMLALGYPMRSPDIMVYKNHALCYDQQKKIPHWVIELLIKDDLKGTSNREKSNFKSDPHIPALFSAQNDDYSKSGWSRGHMAAAGNHKFDQEAMNETFLLTNIVPQDFDNNAGYWNRVEIHCRELLSKYQKVWVVSGPLFLPVVEGNLKFIKYQVIGNSEVAVPTHLYKIIIADDNRKKYLAAFVLPNKAVPRERTLKEHQVPLEFVEKKSGFTFFPKLDRKSAEDLCKVGGCQMRSWQEFEIFYITKKMESAKNLNRLEKAWKEIQEKGLKPDNEATDVYRRKKIELEKLGAIDDRSAQRS